MKKLSDEEVWQKVKSYAQRCMREQTPIYTLNRHVKNYIEEVTDTRIYRKSESGRARGRQSSVSRGDVIALWRFFCGREPQPSVLYFTWALMAEAFPDVPEVKRGVLELRSDPPPREGQAGGEGRTWIFQGSPDYFDILKYVRSGLRKITWTVKRSGKNMRPGDLVYLWQAAGRGKAKAGIVASARIASEVWHGPDHAESLPFWKNQAEAKETHARVWLELEKVVGDEQIIRRDTLLKDPAFSGLLILSQAAGTNFEVSPLHRDGLRVLWSRVGEGGSPRVVAPRTPGTVYREAKEALGPREPRQFTYDPDVYGRGYCAHSKTQNALAKFLRDLGAEPRSPDADGPQFDLLWVLGGFTYVAEVKSLTDENEERQLRLGVGQVLRYRQKLRSGGTSVFPVLVVEKQPDDDTWLDLCDELQIIVVWPDVFAERLLAPQTHQ